MGSPRPRNSFEVITKSQAALAITVVMQDIITVMLSPMLLATQMLSRVDQQRIRGGQLESKANFRFDYFRV